MGTDASGNLYVVWDDRLDSKCCTDIVISRRGPATEVPPPPEPFEETIPPEGGTVVSNDPLESVVIQFPPGAVSADTQVTYAYEPAAIAGSSPFLPAQNLRNVGPWFDISATQNGEPVTTFNKPITIEVRYMDAGIIATPTISLYWLDGTDWLTDGVTTVVQAPHVVTSTVDHLTRFSLMGKGGPRVYLPMVLKAFP